MKDNDAILLEATYDKVDTGFPSVKRVSNMNTKDVSINDLGGYTRYLNSLGTKPSQSQVPTNFSAWKDTLGIVISTADPAAANKLAEELDAYISKFPTQYTKNRLMQILCDIVWENADAYIPSPEAQKAMGIDLED
jgi:hypothetical protein